MLDPDPKLTCPQRCSSPFVPSSGCTIATSEVKLEAELSIRTFQKYHRNAPVYVIGDGPTKKYLQSLKFDGPVLVFERALRIPPTVQKHNDYHRADAILWKMEVFDLAVKQSGDSVFFDADIIFLAPISGPEDCEVALSHNLPCLPAEHDGKLHGFFNAGLVWTCNPKFANWWKHQYLNMGGFYEQVGMNFSPRVFRCGYFDFGHNYGFWRGDFENRTLKSVHLHLGHTLDKTMPDFMIKCVRKMRRAIWKKLGKEKPEIARIARKILRFPTKLFFVHYPKAAGTYIDTAFKEHIVPDYIDCCTWSHKNITDDLLSSGRENLYLCANSQELKDSDLKLAKEKGWKTFTFLRNPMDVICSLYFWRQKMLAKNKPHLLSEFGELTLVEFWNKVLEPEYKRLWSLPTFINDIEEVMMFSEENLTKFCFKHFGYTYLSREKMNTSGNPGFEQLISDGTITEPMLVALCDTEEYKQFSAFVSSLKSI